MRLDELGWDGARAEEFAAWRDKQSMQAGRVAIEFNHNYRVYVDDGEIEAVAAGRLKHHAQSRADLPAVGDWVAVRKRPDEDRGAIQAILPRRSKFSRRAAGNVTGEQVVAANVDVVFLVMGLDHDFSVRRLERYMLLARESGAAPVVLLTKPDMCDDVPARVADVVSTARDLPVHVLNPRSSEGVDRVGAYLTPGVTGALLGSSGVGKSTIINRLVGRDIRKTREVREEDSKGRHVTTHRELIRLPGGGLIIDTPGMRELQLWDVNEAVRETFDEIEALAAECHFSDCRHREEPRCAVKAAVAEGRVPQARYESYLKLQDELAHLAAQQDERERIEEKRQGKIGAKALRARLRDKGKK
jgi:ribosome biogenesis GTPase / thiamine phosphate phosphatase